MRLRNATLAFLFAAAGLPPAAGAQDVEMLARHYGTEPPQAYYETLERFPDAFTFSRGRAVRLAARFAAEVSEPGLARVLGPRPAAAVGTFRIPVVLGRFSDSPVPEALPYGREDVQTGYFGAAPGTITDFYDEMSRGLATLEGNVLDWTEASFTQEQAAGGTSGLTQGTTGAFITQLLARISGVDWGQYDNDGPDGVPNSGDDDGFVDVLAVIHPTRGAECSGRGQADRIWSHHWSLRFSAGSTFTTTVPAAGGGFIRIDDYTVQPLLACNETDLNEIGVFAHELGHTFGLPDLYDTESGIDGNHNGAGHWDLMSAGAWGCRGTTPETPCHLGAWSKAALGWVDVTTISADAGPASFTLPAVESSGTVYRIDAGDGSGEYLLLENRQPIGYDVNLMGNGLLIWQIDADWVLSRWASNRVNAYAHMGVWLRQADGRDDLGAVQRGRGDSGDPFPHLDGEDLNDVFHAGSNPSSHSYQGSATGVTLLDIARAGGDVTFRLSTRFSRISMRTAGGAGSGDVFRVNGSPIAAPTHEFLSAPFEEHRLEAAPGESISDGVRRPFVGWDDDASAPADRTIETPLTDAEYVARYTGRQYELALVSEGGVGGVEPGIYTSTPASPDLWFDEGADVTLTATATTGFEFLGWTGALAGQPNPAALTMTAPVDAGAAFLLTYALPSTPVSFASATTLDVQLVVENGTAPVVWQVVGGTLPEGVTLDAFGRVGGAALEMGSFPVTMRATDARGLSLTGEVVFEAGDPQIGLDRLTSIFLGVGPRLTDLQISFLDRHGNRTGNFDLGDLRAWVLANPGLPFTAQQRALIGGQVVIGMQPIGDGGGTGR